MFTKSKLLLPLLPRNLSLLRHPLTILPPTTHRPFSHSTRLSFPRKDSQDKDSINREATEYAKSGTDDQTAAIEDAAFDPSKTDPEEQLQTAGAKSGDSSNPLEVSPANNDVSKSRDPTEGGAESSSSSSSASSNRERTSGRGSPKKGSKVA